MSRFFRIAAVLALLASTSGCAKFPAGGIPTTIREISFSMDFAGPINDNDYYFTAIDTTGGGPGPIPVFPGIVSGEGWLTGSATHYVQYHQRLYTVYRIISLQPFRSEPAGSPIRYTIPDSGSKTLAFTLDLNTLGASGSSIDVNIISTDQPLGNVRLLDGLGITGNSFITVDLLSNRPITNSESLNPEAAGDVLDQNLSVQPANAQTNSLDITDWTITLGL